MKRFGLLSTTFALALTVACSGNGQHAHGTGTQSAVGTTGDQTAPEVSRGDRNFVSDMLADGNAEVELGKLAEQKASSPQVKRFARMMVEDHSKAGDQLKQIAGTYDIQPDTAKNSDDAQDLMNKLSKLNGAEFDREYMNAMVDNHSNAVDKLESRVDVQKSATGATGTTGTLPNSKAQAEENGNVSPEHADNHAEASLNNWAADTLPTVRHHLEDAKQIQARLTNTSRRDTVSKAAPNTSDTRHGIGKAKY
jgi:putative membrane protein